MKHTFLQHPLTKAETTGIDKIRRGTVVACVKCGKAGGTLIKDIKEGTYRHQTNTPCKSK